MSDQQSWARSHPEGTALKVLVQPRSGTSKVVGVQGDALKIRVAAAPVDGAANEALRKFLAKELAVNPRQIDVISGKSARRKVLLVRGVSPEDVRRLSG